MLSIRYLHLKFTSTGLLDYIIHRYGERVEQGAITFRNWIETEYDPVQIRSDFDRLGFWARLKL